jgi:hypothetical protein
VTVTCVWRYDFESAGIQYVVQRGLGGKLKTMSDVKGRRARSLRTRESLNLDPPSRALLCHSASRPLPWLHCEIVPRTETVLAPYNRSSWNSVTSLRASAQHANTHKPERSRLFWIVPSRVTRCSRQTFRHCLTCTSGCMCILSRVSLGLRSVCAPADLGRQPRPLSLPSWCGLCEEQHGSTVN